MDAIWRWQNLAGDGLKDAIQDFFVENQENECHNGICIWNVSELYLEIGFV